MKKKIKITQIRSVIDQKKKVKGTIAALGIKKIHHSVIQNDTPQVRGMITAVRHLVNVEEID